MLKYIVVFGIAMAIFLVFATDDIPFMERNYATSEETRAAAQAANIPKYTRQQATTFVEEDIRANCAVADEYLPHLNSFEVTWMRQPRTDDRHERGYREWTVTDPLTGAYWRLYEDNNEVAPVIGKF